MIKILIAITLLLIVAIVRLAMSCYRKARDVDYWRKAAQDQRQENSEAETNIDRLEREITQTNKAMADHHQCQQKIIDKLTQEVEEGKASLTRAGEALRIISAAARGTMEYKDATIVALQSEITILEELRYCVDAQQDTITAANQLIAKLKAEISLLTAINEAAIDATADAITH